MNPEISETLGSRITGLCEQGCIKGRERTGEFMELHGVITRRRGAHIRKGTHYHASGEGVDDTGRLAPLHKRLYTVKQSKQAIQEGIEFWQAELEDSDFYEQDRAEYLAWQ